MPKGMVKTTNKIVALGEKTGHKHELIGNLQCYAQRGDLKQEIQVVEIVDPETYAKLVHNTHGPQEFSPGLYQITRQQVWNQEKAEAERAMD